MSIEKCTNLSSRGVMSLARLAHDYRLRKVSFVIDCSFFTREDPEYESYNRREMPRRVDWFRSNLLGGLTNASPGSSAVASTVDRRRFPPTCVLECINFSDWQR